jgi:hypothetical protein
MTTDERFDAVENLLSTMETCHICKDMLCLAEDAPHCENCSWDCDEHDEPNCTPLQTLHSQARSSLVTLRREHEERRKLLEEAARAMEPIQALRCLINPPASEHSQSFVIRKEYIAAVGDCRARITAALEGSTPASGKPITDDRFDGQHVFDNPGVRPVWRVGGKVPLNVYEGDRAVCQCHSAGDAGRIVEAMNAPGNTAIPSRDPRDEQIRALRQAGSDLLDALRNPIGAAVDVCCKRLSDALACPKDPQA